MSELQRLKAEIERQDREFEVLFEQLRQLDPQMALAVSDEWMSEVSSPTTSTEAPAPVVWAVRV